MTDPVQHPSAGPASAAGPGRAAGASPWPRRFALATLAAALPLILFGGTVTTLRQGMAEDGWLMPDGHLLWLYPLELRLRNAGVFVEHHHREIGSLVGLLAIGLVVSTFVADRRPLARRLALGTLLAICLQGAVGGLRVLENSPDLAFLHGALAHGVFALIGANAFVASADWRAARPRALAGGRALRAGTALCAVAVYAQIVLGAWLRHSGAALALGLHLLLAGWVVVEVLRSTRGLARAGESLADAPAAGRLTRAASNLRRLVAAQIALGLAAAVGVYGFSGGFEGRVSGFETVFATLHVVVGAVLLWQALGAAMWARRLVSAAPVSVPVPAQPAELARGVAR